MYVYTSIYTYISKIKQLTGSSLKNQILYSHADYVLYIIVNDYLNLIMLLETSCIIKKIILSNPNFNKKKYLL